MNSFQPDRMTPRVTAPLRVPKGSAIKRIALMAKPTTISLAGGIPLDSTFPFKSIQVQQVTFHAWGGKGRPF